MKKLYVASNSVMLHHYSNFLESNGITCLIKNHFLSGAAGDLPLNECWPELWVVHEEDYAQAKKLLADMLSPPDSANTWCCTRCGEMLEGQFTNCWQCGESRYRSL